MVGIAAFLFMICGCPNDANSLCSAFLSSDEWLSKTKENLKDQENSLSFGGWSLEEPVLRERLPDLRREVIFLGSNKRPDASGGKFYLELLSTKDRYVATSGEKVYLQFMPTPDDCCFKFSRIPTDLWLECHSGVDERSLEVKVVYLGLSQSVVDVPKDHARFVLTAPAKGLLEGWEIGGVRVDASFPVKQKMRRLGVDRFLQMHGGPDYAHKAMKERVDFVSLSDENYSRYVAVGDILLWDGDRWQSCGEFEGDHSQAPLMEVKRLDDKVLVIDVWSPDGTSHQAMSLVKVISSPIEITEIIKEFEFIGMRTWSRPIINAGGHRLTLSPDDWVVHTGKSWERIVRADQLEDYLSGKIQGPLFVFDKLDKDARGYVLRGHIFNAQRTLVESVVLPLKQGLDLGVAKDTNDPVQQKPLIAGETASRGG
ncbi:hypothetical protein CP10139811_0671 [Chlamydia ibidis]|uniref:Uncharacterized protein n=2 Tax=Chlamydia ibidis TaxID=1405396 RepID=S7J3R4_9CHLA|nr:hypothetical protein CP10139811_0671 [Chlamydia ibidis]EQM62278.1 hypothetical protein H359_1056 [Chlamydia ibidis 10-1398/6]